MDFLMSAKGYHAPPPERKFKYSSAVSYLSNLFLNDKRKSKSHTYAPHFLYNTTSAFHLLRGRHHTAA